MVRHRIVVRPTPVSEFIKSGALEENTDWQDRARRLQIRRWRALKSAEKEQRKRLVIRGLS